MSNPEKKYKKSDLKLLRTNRAVKRLLLQKKPDFDKVLKEVKYLKELERLQSSMLQLQYHIIKNDLKLIVLFEGRDFAGKGGTIIACTEHLNPRSCKTIALNKPSDSQKQEWYFKRYVDLLPGAGEMIFFDRSWYNRAVVEPVNGFCTMAEYRTFMDEVNDFERMITNDGTHLLKIFLEISKYEQQRRIDIVEKNPLERWHLSDVDRNAQRLWDHYTEYEDKMFKKTHSKKLPWKKFKSDRSMIMHLEVMKYILDYFGLK